jgi:osmotically inducible protein OsmC
MALSAGLEKAGYTANSVETTANVHLSPADGGFRISRIELSSIADVPSIDADTFAQQAEAAKQNCPVSKALAGVDIALDAKLA